MDSAIVAFLPGTPIPSAQSTWGTKAVSPTRTALKRLTPARAATPQCQQKGPSSSNALTALTTRAHDDSKILLDFVRTHTPSATSTAALGAAALLALSPVMPMSSALAEVPEAAPVTALVDDAALVPSTAEQSFNKTAGLIKSNTGVSVRFVLVRSLPFGDSPEEYARELAGQWKLGENDILFTASAKLARGGVFVGDAVRKLLPDDVARSIAEETFGIPAGDERYSTALVDVTNRLIPVLSGETDPGPPVIRNDEVVQRFKTKQETKQDRGKYIKVVGGVLVIAFVAPLIQTFWLHGN